MRAFLLIVIFYTTVPLVHTDGANKFQQLVVGKCLEWTIKKKTKDLNCENLWIRFNAVITNPELKKICQMNSSLYDDFVEYTFKYVTEMPQAVLWSKSRDLALNVCHDAGLCNIVECSPLGYVFDGLDWCDTTLTGTDYGTGCGCSNTSFVYAFWLSASTAYAKRLSGDVGIFLNGSVGKPFDKNRTMATVEIPNLQPQRVRKVTTYLVHDIETKNIWYVLMRMCNFSRSEPNTETCKSPSLVELKQAVEARGIPYECQEDPQFTRHYVCIKHADHKKCGFSGAVKSLHWSRWLGILTAVACISTRKLQ
ncbi:unnamed protein product [Calicophoron daubneyi]|uniref:ADP-ribosyl cyclase/cyclic ADP-ribose hydrolase n=1 Tax=Calicophoron daubneyi TaxID=300641 RepID=A0AAV2T7N4_CALDB